MAMASFHLPPLALLLVLVVTVAHARLEPTIRLPSDDDTVGTRWAVLVAGSNGYQNYRHQADICHAYQILRKGGLKDENIIVFMYDDIAHNLENPRPGVIINHPQGGDVYAGVPKDYTGKEVNVKNLFAVLLGNKTAVNGGSGKVVDSGPNDHIFVFYSDHGGPGVIGMPTYPYVYGDDLVDVLKKKHAAGTYKSLVFYLEACEAGSVFEGLLPNDIGVYATTASNAEESSWGTYCPGEYPSPPPEYDTCLGDLYSISWMEDSDVHNLRTESLKQQYDLVKKRTAQDSYSYGSHVMQYGSLDLNAQRLSLYIGSNPANDNTTFVQDNSDIESGTANAGADSSESDEGNDEEAMEERASSTDRCESVNTMVSFLWWIIGFYWVVTGGDVLEQGAPRLYWLTVVFLAFDVFFAVFCVVVACFIGVALCCCLPCVVAILYALVGQEGASDADIGVLPRYKYSDPSENGEKGTDEGVMIPILNNSGTSTSERILLREDAECCICLSSYEDGVELSALPCNHHFHSTCITKWLRMHANCPLCKYNILKGSEN